MVKRWLLDIYLIIILWTPCYDGQQATAKGGKNVLR